MLSNFWKAIKRDKPVHLIYGPRDERTSATISKLLEIGDDDSLDLAAAISLQQRDLNATVSQQLNLQLADALKSFGNDKLPTRNHIYGLIRSRGTLSEAQLYTNASWCFAAATLSPFISERMAEKIVTMPQVLPHTDHAALRKALAKMIEGPNEYPDGVAAAAMNALIQMDVANREPLSESMWQLRRN